ncbi:hypothetical protein [Streptomyces sp. KE1]|uniref:hypothetical protein n=1 Tax=Streptomyces sp. KE1 TaxID=1638939 RepID=UPI00099DBCFF
MFDALATVGLRPAVLVADTGHGADVDFRHGLEDHGLACALQVKGEMTAHTVLGLQPAGRPRGPGPGPARDATVAHRARLPRAEDEAQPRPLRGPIVHRPAPTPHPRHRRPPPDRTAVLPESPCQGLTPYQVPALLNHLLATWPGGCPTCRQPTPGQPYDAT